MITASDLSLFYDGTVADQRDGPAGSDLENRTLLCLGPREYSHSRSDGRRGGFDDLDVAGEQDQCVDPGLFPHC